MANFKGIKLPDGNIYFPEGSGSAIDTVSVSVDNNTGVPSATGSVSGTTLNLDFKNLKGETGSIGPKGDPGQGVPAGGTAGQVLKKKSGTDYDTEWADETGGGGTEGNNSNWELITSQTLEEEVSSFIVGGNLDEYGFIYFYIRVPSVESTYKLWVSFSKTTSINWSIFSTFDNITVKQPYYVRGISLFGSSDSSFSQTAGASQYPENCSPFSSKRVVLSNLYKYIIVFTNTEGISLPIGTTIEVYGIKKEVV